MTIRTIMGWVPVKQKGKVGNGTLKPVQIYL